MGKKGFLNRTDHSNTLINIMAHYFWLSGEVHNRFLHIPYGYETHVDADTRKFLRHNYTPTAKFIRFMPDYFVIDVSCPEKTYFLEYKTTLTPLYSENRISHIKNKNNMPHLSWTDIGQMEQDAFDSYLLLYESGVNVVIVNYCPYYQNILLCDYIQNITVLHRDVVREESETGSKTPFINFDCNSMRQFNEFMSMEHALNLNSSIYEHLNMELQKHLPIIHCKNSPLFKRRRDYYGME